MIRAYELTAAPDAPSVYIGGSDAGDIGGFGKKLKKLGRKISKSVPKPIKKLGKVYADTLSGKLLKDKIVDPFTKKVQSGISKLRAKNPLVDQYGGVVASAIPGGAGVDFWNATAPVVPGDNGPMMDYDPYGPPREPIGPAPEEPNKLLLYGAIGAAALLLLRK